MLEGPNGSLDFALESLSLEKGWRRCAQGDRINILAEPKFSVLRRGFETSL